MSELLQKLMKIKIRRKIRKHSIKAHYKLLCHWRFFSYSLALIAWRRRHFLKNILSLAIFTIRYDLMVNAWSYNFPTFSQKNIFVFVQYNYFLSSFRGEASSWHSTRRKKSANGFYFVLWKKNYKRKFAVNHNFPTKTLFFANNF